MNQLISLSGKAREQKCTVWHSMRCVCGDSPCIFSDSNGHVPPLIEGRRGYEAPRMFRCSVSAARRSQATWSRAVATRSSSAPTLSPARGRGLEKYRIPYRTCRNAGEKCLGLQVPTCKRRLSRFNFTVGARETERRKYSRAISRLVTTSSLQFGTSSRQSRVRQAALD